MAVPRVVVTAGPTREWIDAVRFISNPSTGRMGFALARAFLERGARVELLAGPTHLEAPARAQVARFETVEDLRRLLLDRYEGACAVVMAAAVGDWRPAHPMEGKWGKRGAGVATSLDLVATPDVLAELGRRKAAQFLVGFALETERLEERARAKMAEKNLDLVVANGPEAFGAGHTEVLLVDRSGGPAERLAGTKEEVARAIAARVFPTPFTG